MLFACFLLFVVSLTVALVCVRVCVRVVRGSAHVLFVHGGAWCWGSGVLYSGFARALAEALDTTVYLLSYPLFPFAHVDDMAASVREASRAAAELAGHPVVVVGHSSGGHLASLSVLMDAHAAPPPPSPPPSLSGSETPPTDVGAELRRPAHPTVRAVVALCAPLHIADHYRHEASRTIKAGSIVLKRGVADISPMAPACGGPANFDSVSPAVLVAATPPHAAVPPHVLVHTRADTTVPVTSSERMHKACQDGRVPSRLVLVPGDHASVITDVMLGTGECGTIHDIIRSVDGVGVCVGVGDAAGVGVGCGSLEV